jgi:hypothetical protein
LVKIRRLFTLTPPFLESGWGDIAQRGVGALVHVDVLQEPTRMPDGTIIVFVLWQVNFLLFSGLDGPLSVAVLPGLPVLGHAGCGLDTRNAWIYTVAAYPMSWSDWWITGLCSANARSMAMCVDDCSSPRPRCQRHGPARFAAYI